MMVYNLVHAQCLREFGDIVAALDVCRLIIVPISQLGGGKRTRQKRRSLVGFRRVEERLR